MYKKHILMIPMVLYNILTYTEPLPLEEMHRSKPIETARLEEQARKLKNERFKAEQRMSERHLHENQTLQLRTSLEKTPDNAEYKIKEHAEKLQRKDDFSTTEVHEHLSKMFDINIDPNKVSTPELAKTIAQKVTNNSIHKEANNYLKDAFTDPKTGRVRELSIEEVKDIINKKYNDEFQKNSKLTKTLADMIPESALEDINDTETIARQIEMRIHAKRKSSLKKIQETEKAELAKSFDDQETEIQNKKDAANKSSELLAQEFAQVEPTAQSELDAQRAMTTENLQKTITSLEKHAENKNYSDVKKELDAFNEAIQNNPQFTKEEKQKIKEFAKTSTKNLNESPSLVDRILAWLKELLSASKSRKLPGPKTLTEQDFKNEPEKNVSTR